MHDDLGFNPFKKRAGQGELFSIKCHYTADESLVRLSENVIQNVFKGCFVGSFTATVVGPVTKENVHLRYASPADVFWKPHFIGWVDETEGQVRLIGNFQYRGLGHYLFCISPLLVIAAGGLMFIPDVIVTYLPVSLNRIHDINWILLESCVFLNVALWSIFFIVAAVRRKDVTTLANFMRHACRR